MWCDMAQYGKGSPMQCIILHDHTPKLIATCVQPLIDVNALFKNCGIYVVKKVIIHVHLEEIMLNYILVLCIIMAIVVSWLLWETTLSQPVHVTFVHVNTLSSMALKIASNVLTVWSIFWSCIKNLVMPWQRWMHAPTKLGHTTLFQQALWNTNLRLLKLRTWFWVHVSA